MAPSTNSPSIMWAVGDTTGRNVSNGTAAIPSRFFNAQSTVVPTAAPTAGQSDIYITSGYKLFFYNGSAWVGPYVTA